MSRGRRIDAYARAIEGALSQLHGRPAVLSPRDFGVLADWYERGVPLGVVLEAIEDLGRRPAKRRGKAGVRRGLAYFTPAVEEAWDVIRSGRMKPGSVATPALPPRSRALGAWRSALLTAPADSPFGRLLAEAIERLAGDPDPERFDREIDDRLADAAPSSLREEAEAEADRQLSPFRTKMSAENYAATRKRAVADRLRRALCLPRLALTDPLS